MSTLAKRLSLAVLVAALSASCTVKDTEAPPLSGPSSLAMRIALSLVPDSIPQDGQSQTALNIEATGPDGRPMRGLTLRIALSEGGVFYDAGTLSGKMVVTGDDGRARATYTAPPRQPDGNGNGTVVTFFVTPVGNDFRADEARQIDLRLVPVGVILPPNGTPIARFTYTPTTVTAFSTVIFDASTSTDVDPVTLTELPVRHRLYVYVGLWRWHNRNRRFCHTPVPNVWNVPGAPHGHRQSRRISANGTGHNGWLERGTDGRIHDIADESAGGTGGVLQRRHLSCRTGPTHRLL